MEQGLFAWKLCGPYNSPMDLKCRKCLRLQSQVALRFVKFAKYVLKNTELAALKQTDFCSQRIFVKPKSN